MDKDEYRILRNLRNQRRVELLRLQEPRVNRLNRLKKHINAHYETKLYKMTGIRWEVIGIERQVAFGELILLTFGGLNCMIGDRTKIRPSEMNIMLDLGYEGIPKSLANTVLEYLS